MSKVKMGGRDTQKRGTGLAPDGTEKEGEEPMIKLLSVEKENKPDIELESMKNDYYSGFLDYKVCQVIKKQATFMWRDSGMRRREEILTLRYNRNNAVIISYNFYQVLKDLNCCVDSLLLSLFYCIIYFYIIIKVTILSISVNNTKRIIIHVLNSSTPHMNHVEVYYNACNKYFHTSYTTQYWNLTQLISAPIMWHTGTASKITSDELQVHHGPLALLLHLMCCCELPRKFPAPQKFNQSHNKVSFAQFFLLLDIFIHHHPHLQRFKPCKTLFSRKYIPSKHSEYFLACFFLIINYRNSFMSKIIVGVWFCFSRHYNNCWCLLYYHLSITG
ncbi:hypothetical protein VP01_1801g1 [Puccinia sorghi]|uniref:Uncharacterized protein n=1 Tax=Puccinia sorghi TaxID=27349 RepID=A0A0L6VE96_9BASI|nr:hypothetical protein VP01_1801g1 [Puccinia sorghi]